MVLAEGIARYEARVSEPVTRVERSWAGLRTLAPDRQPVIGFDPDETRFSGMPGRVAMASRPRRRPDSRDFS